MSSEQPANSSFVTSAPSMRGVRPLSVTHALQSARDPLAPLDDAHLTATALLAHVFGLTRTQLLARPELPLAPEQATAFAALLARAAQGEPLAYLTGQREFYGLEFEVDARVLVPRPETELLVDRARAARPARVLDVGTGSGCIAVALAVHLPQAALTASDVSASALAVASRNAQRHHVADRIRFVQSDLLNAWQPPASGFRLLTSDFQPPFQLICANLPYIDPVELRALAVSRFEPQLALAGGRGGLALIERLLSQAPSALAPGGRLLLEIGASQGPAALALARGAFPAAAISLERDLAGLDRLLVIETH